jgi:hypothetical protein
MVRAVLSQSVRCEVRRPVVTEAINARSLAFHPRSRSSVLRSLSIHCHASIRFTEACRLSSFAREASARKGGRRAHWSRRARARARGLGSSPAQLASLHNSMRFIRKGSYVKVNLCAVRRGNGLCRSSAVGPSSRRRRRVMGRVGHGQSRDENAGEYEEQVCPDIGRSELFATSQRVSRRRGAVLSDPAQGLAYFAAPLLAGVEWQSHEGGQRSPKTASVGRAARGRSRGRGVGNPTLVPAGSGSPHGNWNGKDGVESALGLEWIAIRRAHLAIGACERQRIALR